MLPLDQGSPATACSYLGDGAPRGTRSMPRATSSRPESEQQEDRRVVAWCDALFAMAAAPVEEQFVSAYETRGPLVIRWSPGWEDLASGVLL